VSRDIKSKYLEQGLLPQSADCWLCWQYSGGLGDRKQGYPVLELDKRRFRNMDHGSAEKMRSMSYQTCIYIAEVFRKVPSHDDGSETMAGRLAASHLESHGWDKQGGRQRWVCIIHVRSRGPASAPRFSALRALARERRHQPSISQKKNSPFLTYKSVSFCPFDNGIF
jgi:hypothetical protein